MVTARASHPVLAACLLAASCTAAVADGEPVLGWSRPAAATVRTTAVGLGDDRRDPVAEGEPCATFRPAPKAVAAYFARAKPITKREYLHETDFSACHATGTLQLRDGRAAEWTILRGGSGVVRAAGKTAYLLCEPCLASLDPRRP